MALDKVLNRIQLHIKELAPTLELFVDQSVQPSVKDCESLQEQICKLQENLAIYKYHKQEKELSPSFNIHAKVSEQVKKITEDIKQEPVIKTQETSKTEHEKIVTNDSEIKTAPLVIGINDKFRFINELFRQNASEYNIAIEQLGAVRSWAEAETYLHSLTDLYQWKEENEVVKYFYSVIKKRFS
jgi:hypothetical protein